MLRIPHQCEKVFRYHRGILVMAVLLTVIGTWLSLKLPLRSDLDDLLPDDFPSVQAMNRMRAEVGGSGRLRVVLEAPDFAAMRRLAETLDPALTASPLVQYVDYRNNTAFYQTNALLFLEEDDLDSLYATIKRTIDDRKQALNPFMVDDLFGDDEPGTADSGGDELADWEARYQDLEPRPYYTNADSTVLVMEVFPAQGRSDLNFVREMLAEVRGIIDSVGPTNFHPEVQVYYGGSLKNRIDEFDVIKGDILGTALYGVGGVFLLIMLFFRRVVGPLLISASLLMSLTWTFGVTYLVLGELNTITGFMFVILFGLGIDYGVHTFARYMESREAGNDPAAAIDAMVCQTGSAVGTTALTTAAAFFLLLLMDFKGFAHLGFIAGTGVLFAFVAMVMVLPSLLIVAERFKLIRYQRRAPAAGLTVEQIKRPIPGFRVVLWSGAVLTALALLISTRIEFEYDFTNLRTISPERQIVSEKTEGVFRLSESPAVVLADSRAEVEEIVAAVKGVMRQDTLTPTVDNVRSIFSIVPENQTGRLERIKAIRDLVETEAEGVVTGQDKERLDRLQKYLEVDQPFTWDDFPAEDKRQFINTKGEIGNFVFIYPGVPLRDGRQAIAFRDDIGKITTASGKDFYAASSNIISAEMLSLMMEEGAVALGLALLVVALLVWLDFGNLRAGLLVLAPLLLGFVWTGGIMGLIGMKLNFYNIVVLPSIVGIGVDNGVHLYHRYLEEGPGTLMLVLRRTGWAITMTTLTTIVGYSGLVMAHHPGLQSIGWLAVVGISMTFVTAVVFLPSLLQFLEARKKPSMIGDPV